MWDCLAVGMTTVKLEYPEKGGGEGREEYFPPSLPPPPSGPGGTLEDC